MPPFFMFSNSDATYNPWSTGTKCSKSRCEICMKQEALDDLRLKFSQGLIKSSDHLYWPAIGTPKTYIRNCCSLKNCPKVSVFAQGQRVLMPTGADLNE